MVDTAGMVEVRCASYSTESGSLPFPPSTAGDPRLATLVLHLPRPTRSSETRAFVRHRCARDAIASRNRRNNVWTGGSLSSRDVDWERVPFRKGAGSGSNPKVQRGGWEKDGFGVPWEEE
eukprot:scaffold2031_cov318-Pavlova_lutheri.AAC.2